LVIGRDARGRSTALVASALPGGASRSKDAAIRYAQAGRAHGTVRCIMLPLEHPFTRDRIGRGEGLAALAVLFLTLGEVSS
jgi:hypothetical protein